MVSTDEKSGYDHVRLSVESQKYFGIQFGVTYWYIQLTYIYQTKGMVETSYLRTLLVVTVQHIDNRLGVKSDAEA